MSKKCQRLAENFAVNDTTDANDSAPGDGVRDRSGNARPLRSHEEVNALARQAQRSTVPHTIQPSAGAHTLTRSGRTEDDARSGD
jgi:hypothetical protein